MTAFNLLHPNHVMGGVDLHDAKPPGSATKVPSLPHGVGSPLRGAVAGAGYDSKVLHAPKVQVYFCDALQRSTDIGGLIPHLGYNTLVPLIMIDSKSKSEFGAGTVRVQGRPVAVAVFMDFNLNLNCGDPIRLPSGHVPAPHTVRAGMTQGDLLVGLCEMAFDMAWALMKSKVFKAAISPAISRILGKTISTFLKGNPSLQAQVEKAFKIAFGKAVDGAKTDPESFDKLIDEFEDPKHRVFL